MKKLFVLVPLLVFLYSCTHDPEVLTTDDPPNPPPNGIPCDPDTVYFQNTILPFFQSTCAKSGCHDAATHQEDVILDNYSNIMNTGDIEPGNPGNSDVYEAITEDDPLKRMPKDADPLTPAQIEMIGTWILQGALNNYCQSEDCDSVNVTYSSTLVPILQTFCLGCHSGATPSGGHDFSTHADLAALALSGQLMKALEHDPSLSQEKWMPQGGNKLDNCKIAQFRKWVNDGAPNNK